MKQIQIAKSAFELIKNTVGKAPAEQGGLLFGSSKDMIVREYVHDPVSGTSATYTINSEYFNPIISQKSDEGLEVIGIIHSHPVGYTSPSPPDVRIFNKYLSLWGFDNIITPIIMSSGDNQEFELHPFIFSVKNAPKYTLLKGYEIIDDVNLPPLQITPIALDDFSRIEDAIDMDIIQNSKITVIGVGGAYSLCENLVRSGVLRLTIIDPDVVEKTNITRQGYILSDVGTPKVLALKKHLLTINPSVEVNAIQSDFTKFNDSKLLLLKENTDLLLMLTDSFKCQAFGNIFATRFEIKTIWGGYHNKSRTAEIFFYIPNITEACFRCAMSGRYELQQQKATKISSRCNTIFHSNWLDAQIGMLVFAILMNGTTDKEFSNWFGSSFNHNLIHLKSSPLAEKIFSKTNGANNLAFFNFGSIWEELNKETIDNGYDYNCPDCCSTLTTI